MTVAEIKAELDVLGVEYDNKMLKAELKSLLDEHKPTEYKVIFGFKDLKDKNHVYKKGDVYPREGSNPGKERIRELASYKNKIGRKLISEQE